MSRWLVIEHQTFASTTCEYNTSVVRVRRLPNEEKG